MSRVCDFYDDLDENQRTGRDSGRRTRGKTEGELPLINSRERNVVDTSAGSLGWIFPVLKNKYNIFK